MVDRDPAVSPAVALDVVLASTRNQSSSSPKVQEEFVAGAMPPNAKAWGSRWIVTFHDETLDVTAAAAQAFAMRFVTTGEEAIASVKRGG